MFVKDVELFLNRKKEKTSVEVMWTHGRVYSGWIRSKTFMTRCGENGEYFDYGCYNSPSSFISLKLH